MVLGTAVDSNLLSYLMLVIMKEQGAVVGRGGASPQPSGEAELALRCRTRQSQPSAIGRGRASPQMSGEVEPALGPLGEAESSPQGSNEAELIFRHSGKKCSSVLV